MEIFNVKIDDLQPSQLYISQGKLEKVQEWFSTEQLEAIPVVKILDKLVLTDGHTRVLTALLAGWTEISVYYDTDDLDLNIYKTCVSWAQEEKIFSPKDLKNRIISEKDYQKRWIERCEQAFGE